MFFKCIDPETEQHSGDYIYNVLSGCIEEIGPHKILSVCTDNAPNMKMAWKKIQEKYPHILTYGCVAHCLNLMAKDLLRLSSFDKIFKQTKKIIQFFRNKHIPRQVLRKVQLEENSTEIALIVPSETRWCSAAISFESVLKNKNAIQKAILDKAIRTVVDSSVRRYILDEDNFWPRLTSCYGILKPILDTITQLEGDVNSISKVTPGMQKLLGAVDVNVNNLQKDMIREIKKIIEARMEYLHHSVHLAAYMLHPKYCGIGCSESEMSEAIEFIANFSSDRNYSEETVLGDLAEFRSKQGFFSKTYLWKAAINTEPITWWKGFCDEKELSKVAVKILSLPASAASCERNWKVFSHTKTKKRNRLKIEKTNKLVSIKFNLQLLDDEDLKVVDESEETNDSVDNDDTMIVDDSEDVESSIAMELDSEMSSDHESESSDNEENSEMIYEAQQNDEDDNEEKREMTYEEETISEDGTHDDLNTDMSYKANEGCGVNDDESYEGDSNTSETNVSATPVFLLPEGKQFFILRGLPKDKI